MLAHLYSPSPSLFLLKATVVEGGAAGRGGQFGMMYRQTLYTYSCLSLPAVSPARQAASFLDSMILLTLSPIHHHCVCVCFYLWLLKYSISVYLCVHVRFCKDLLAECICRCVSVSARDTEDRHDRSTFVQC